MMRADLQFERDKKNIRFSIEQLPMKTVRDGNEVMLTIKSEHEDVINLLLSSSEYTILAKFISKGAYMNDLTTTDIEEFKLWYAKKWDEWREWCKVLDGNKDEKRN